jgi:hypothetical protein
MKKNLLIILLMFASGGTILAQHDDVYSYNLQLDPAISQVRSETWGQ